MARRTAARLVATIAWLLVGMTGTAIAAGQDGEGAGLKAPTAERLVARLGEMRGAIGPVSRALGGHDRTATHSVPARTATRAAIVPVLEPVAPFSGPLFVLIGEPIARSMPDRPIRVVYQGTVLAAGADRW